MNIHDGHRRRVKERFRQHGMDIMEDHEVLEVLLCFGVPRGDVNPLAHRLVNRFGSLAGVLDAKYEELMEVEGVGEHVATLIKTIPQICRRYLISREQMEGILNTSERAGNYIMPYFFGERDEVVYVACMDAKCKVLGCKLAGRGNVNSASVSVRKIVELALNFNSTYIIMAHNHTSGLAFPSQEDVETTLKVEKALAAVDVKLVDHIVVADRDFVSLAHNGVLKTSWYS